VSLSLKERVAQLPKDERDIYIRKLSPEQAAALAQSWKWLARPEQITPDGTWKHWLILSGRGWGKTRTAAEFIVDQVIRGNAKRIALVGRTAADVRDVMVEGPSGILAVARLRGIKAKYEPSKTRITFGNGATAHTYTAEEPSKLRGPEHDLYWADELASWQMAKSSNKAQETWDNLQMGLRIGKHPRGIVTTTPRPVPLVRLIKSDTKTITTVGTTFDNERNLSESFLEDIRKRYEGTRVGRQELFGEILEDVEGALWTYETIETNRVSEAPELSRIVVAIDPAVSTSEKSDFTAITVCGLSGDDFYVLHSEAARWSPNEWASRALALFDQYHADKLIAEKNNGGDMVAHTIRTIRKTAPIKTVHASRGKHVRAEPVAALYEQGRVKHVGIHQQLEDQMITFPVATDHDDLVDSLVYAITDLDPSQKKAGSQLYAF
jgi:predicted phage terminase large subunit-like protein